MQNLGASNFLSNKKTLENLTGCKKPKNVIAQSILFGNPIKLAKDAKKYKQDMKNYRACLANYKSNVEASKDASARAEVQKLEAEEKMAQVQEESSNSGRLFSELEPEEKKFLWMPQKIGIPVTIIGGLLLIYGAFKGVEYIKNKK